MFIFGNIPAELINAFKAVGISVRMVAESTVQAFSNRLPTNPEELAALLAKLNKEFAAEEESREEAEAHQHEYIAYAVRLVSHPITVVKLVEQPQSSYGSTLLL